MVSALAGPALESELKRAVNSSYQVLVPQYPQLAQSGDVNTTNCYAWWDAELSVSHWNAFPRSQFLGKLPREAGRLGNKGPLSGFASCPAKPDLFGTWSMAKLCVQRAADLEGGRGGHVSRWRQVLTSYGTNKRTPISSRGSLPETTRDRQPQQGSREGIRHHYQTRPY